MSLGLEEAGFSVVAAADSDPIATETYAANIQGLTWTGDLSDPTEFLRHLDNWGIESVDLLGRRASMPAFLNRWHVEDR